MAEMREKSTGNLFSDAAQQIADLVRGQVELARAEAEEKLHQAVGGIVMILAAAVLAIAALNLVCGALVSWLVEEGGLSPGWAALIVAAAVAVIAGILAWVGLRWIAPSRLYPRRTATSLRRDAEQIKEIVKNDPAQ